MHALGSRSYENFPNWCQIFKHNRQDDILKLGRYWHIYIFIHFLSSSCEYVPRALIRLIDCSIELTFNICRIFFTLNPANNKKIAFFESSLEAFRLQCFESIAQSYFLRLQYWSPLLRKGEKGIRNWYEFYSLNYYWPWRTSQHCGQYSCIN